MKKLIFTMLAFSVLSALHADFKKPTRTVEIGIDAEAGASNSYLGLKDIFKEQIVIDLKEIAAQMNGEGLTFDFYAKAGFHTSIQGEFNRYTFFTNLESSGYANVPQEMFDILSEGIKVGDDKEMELHAYGDVFLETGFSYYKKWDNLAISIRPAFVVPILYVEDATAKVSYYMKEDGRIGTRVDAPLTVYSALGLQPFVDNDFNSDDITGSIGNIARGGGFDLSLAVEKKLLKTLDGSIYTRIPIVPGTLNNKMTARYWAFAYENNLLGYLDDTEEHDADWGKEDVEYSSADYSVFRPFRLGVEGMWRPFGNWSYFKFGLGLAVRNPYSSNAIVYPEGELSADFKILNIIGFNFGAFYANRVWTQKVGVMINCHVLEIDAFAGFRCADFSRTFNMTGAAAGVSVKMGW